MDTKLYQVYQNLITKRQNFFCQFEDSNGKRCENFAILSHTVQRSRTLAAIAENGHVTRINYDGFRPQWTERVGYKKIGVKKASVFPGFCEHHDHDLFSSVESGSCPVSEREQVLLSFRAICHELYKKETVIFAYSDENFRSIASKQGILGFIDGHLLGCKRAREDLKRSRLSHLAYLHENKGNFRSILFKFDSVLPFAFSSTFAPEFDARGISILPREDMAWGSVSCLAGQVKGISTLLFSGFDDVAHHPVSRFIESLHHFDLARVGGFALHIGIEFAENLYFRPSWINSQLPEIKNELVKRFSEGVPGLQSQRKKELTQQFDIVCMQAKVQH